MKKRRYEKDSNQSLSFPRWIIAATFMSASVMLLSFGVYIGPTVIDHAAGSIQSVSSKAAAWKEARKRNEEMKQAEQAAQTENVTSIYNLQNTIPHLAAAQEKAVSDGWGVTSDIAEDEITYTAMLDTALGPMMYYNQGDSRWADYLYGGEDPMIQYGCGPTAVAMLINSFSAVTVTPVEAADWASANGCHAPQGGSYHNLIRDSLSAYGFKVQPVRDRTPENTAALLESGHILVALMGEGRFTDNGHFLLITELVDENHVRIADPNNFDNCQKDWNLSELLSELKKVYDHGAPLWAVSIPDQ